MHERIPVQSCGALVRTGRELAEDWYCLLYSQPCAKLLKLIELLNNRLTRTSDVKTIEGSIN